MPELHRVKSYAAAAITAFFLTVQALPAQDYNADSAGNRQFMFLPAVVAEINGRKITSDEAIQTLKQKLPLERMMELPASRVRTLIRENINDSIDRSIIEQKLKAGNIKPSPEMVLTEFRRMFNSLTPDKKAFLVNELAGKNLTLEQYQARTSLDPREQFRIAFNKWIELSFADKLTIQDDEIENFYRKNQGTFAVPATVTVSQILIKKGNSKEAAGAMDKAQTVLARLLQGEDFGKLAEQFSDCSVSKSRKGLLGTFRADGELPPEVEKAAFALKAGEFSEIIDDQIGLFVIKVNSRTEPCYLPYETMKEVLRIRLRDDKIRAMVQEVLQQERARMQININI